MKNFLVLDLHGARQICFGFVLLVFFFHTSSVSGADHPIYLWTAGSFTDADPANDNNHWENPDNWEVDGQPGVPTTNAIVQINSGYPQATNKLDLYRLELDMRFGGQVSVTELELGSLSALNGSITGGMVTLKPDGISDWSYLNLSGKWSVKPGAVINFAGGAVFLSDTVLMNEGTMNNASLLGCSSWITNCAGGVINLATDGAFTGVLTGYEIPVLHNAVGGLIRKTGGSGDSFFGPFRFINAGEVRAETGTFWVGPWLQEGGLFSGPGRINFSGERLSGTVIVSNTVLRYWSANPLQLLGTNATITTPNNGVFEWVGTQGTASGGRFRGQITFAAGSRIDLIGGDWEAEVGSVINNYGTINWIDPGQLRGFGLGTMTLNNLAGGIFNVNTNGAAYCLVFNNEPGAVFRKTGPGTCKLVDWILNNRSEVQVESGELNYWTTVNAGDGSSFSGAGLHHFTGGHFDLSGTTTANGTALSVDGAILAGVTTNAALASTNGGIWDWRNTTLGGTLSIGTGTLVRVAGGSQPFLSGYSIINNRGRVVVSNDSKINLEDAGGAIAWNNLAGGVFEVSQGSSPFLRYFDYAYPVVFSNAPGSLFFKNVGTGAATLRLIKFVNAGTVSATAGALEFNCPLTLLDGGCFTGTSEHRILASATLSGRTTVKAAALILTGRLNGLDEASTIATEEEGAFAWRGGILEGAITFAPGSHVQTTTTGFKQMEDAIIRNHGIWDCQIGSGISAYSAYWPCIIDNQSDGVMNLLTNVNFTTSVSSAFQAHFTNSGILNIGVTPSRFSTSWDMHLLPGGQLNLVLAGSANGQLSQLAGFGVMELGGAVVVTLTNGFVPTNGSSFAIIAHGMGLGSFGSISLPNLPVGLRWRIQYDVSLYPYSGSRGVMLRVERDRVDTATRLPNGHFQLSFSSQPASACLVEVSDDLITWTPAHTNSPFTGELLFDDPDAAYHTKRFYRVRLDP